MTAFGLFVGGVILMGVAAALRRLPPWHARRGRR